MIPSKKVRTLLGMLLSLSAIAGTLPWVSAQTSGLRFEILVPSEIRSEPITGRIFLILSRDLNSEPYLQIGRTGTPFFGRDVEHLSPGEPGAITSSDLGSPVPSLAAIPPGEYYVQAFVSIYSEFKRADGHVVWMHDDQWEGQQWNRSPGNLYSNAQQLWIDPASDEVITLEATNVIPPVAIPPDTQWVQRFRFQSDTLSEFWGRPIFLGATVLLPKDYDSTTINYPIIYEQGHFSLRAPMRFSVGGDLHDTWIQDNFPRIIVATFQHPNPYFDDSYAVNSVNVGPYGDAILQELIPEIEARYRVIKEPWARALTGGSTGGWEALALQIFNPDFFGGTWAYCPDPVTFYDVEGINIYSDTNAFYKQHEWRKVPTPNTRETNGEIRLTSKQRNHFELVNGTKGRSGQQLDIWSAVYGPLGDDGYFKPLFNKFTGEIDHEVATYWKKHYDLMHYLERNWPEIGDKLVDKLHVYTGTMDNFYLNNSTKMLQNWMKTTTDPHYEGFFLYGEGKGHCWTGPVTQGERIKEIGQHMMNKMPETNTAPWWRY